MRWSQHAASHLLSVAVLVLSAAVAILLSVTDSSTVLDEQLRVMRERVLERPASGTLHIVEIDAASIRAMESWPWKRSVHALLVDRLKAAGAKTIAFDVDFSARSEPAEDLRFARALQRAGGGVILPTFRQLSDTGSRTFVENLPIAPLRENAFLASVNVHPDRDGTIHNYSFGTVTGGIPRPSMAAMLAGVRGKAEGKFAITTAIDPATLPRHRAIDIISGKVGQRELSGKTLLIGATAIELGDRYAMPKHGMQPGVVIQALAAETLIQGLAPTSLGSWPALLVAAVGIVAMLRASRRALHVAVGLPLIMLILALPLAVELTGLATLNVGSALGATMAGLGILILGDIIGRFNTLRLIDTETGLPNERSLHRALSRCDNGFLIVMKVRNHSEIAAIVSDDQRKILVGQISDRIVMGTGCHAIYSLGDGRLAWSMPGGDLIQLTEMLHGLAALFTSKISLGAQRVIAAPVFGIAPTGKSSDGAEVIQASLAASQAAGQGCRWLVYGSEMADSTGREQRLLADLDDAISQRDIYLLFQPQWSIAKDRIDGVEALLRWQHPILGPIPPDEFIPMLEQNERMAELTLHIIAQCTELASKWDRQGRDIRIAMNISAPLFTDAKFAAEVIERVAKLGPIAHRMIVEITESAIVLDDAQMIDVLKQLRAMGVRVSIDDYGTGQSTLSYLKKFPADEIKIDKSFVTRMLDEANDQILVRSTIELAHELGFSVVAEGVEDESCFGKLREFGCDTIQGWHIGRPVSLSEVEAKADEPARLSRLAA